MSDTNSEGKRSILGGCLTIIVVLFTIGWLFGGEDNSTSETASEDNAPSCENVQGLYSGLYEAHTTISREVNSVILRIRANCDYALVLDDGDAMEGKASYEGTTLTLEPDVGATTEAQLENGRVSWEDRGDNYRVFYDLRRQ